MSVKVTSWVWHHSPVTNRCDLLVLLALADHARDDGSGAYPAVATLAEKARLSRRGTYESLARLKAAGAIRPEGRGPQGTVAYRIHMGVQAAHGAGAAGGVQESAKGVQQPARGGAGNSTKGVRPTAPEPTPEPSENHPENRGARERASASNVLPPKPSPPNLKGKEWPETADLEREHAAEVNHWFSQADTFAGTHFPDVTPKHVLNAAAELWRLGADATVENLLALGEQRPRYALVRSEPNNVVEFQPNAPQAKEEAA